MRIALTPAESFVLWKGPHQPAETLKIALLSLLAQGILLNEERVSSGRFGTKQVRYLRQTGKPLGPAPAYLGMILQDVQGDALAEQLKSMRQRFGAGFARLTRDHIMGELVRRGLVTFEPRRLFGIPLWRVMRETPAGMAEKGRIATQVKEARRIPSFLDSDPARAAAIALAAGAVLLLVPELREHYGEIGRVLRTLQPDTAIQGGDGAGSVGASFETGPLDPRAFESLDDAMSDFGSSFDAASGGDSGDGGGGDGGGGGGD